MKRFLFAVFVGTLLLTSIKSHAQIVGTISVGDVVSSADKNQFQSNESLISAITIGLNAALIKSRKFNVLSYDELQNRLQSQGRSLNGYYTNAYANDSYDQAGLDYILTANVSDFDVLKQLRAKTETAVAIIDLDFKLYGVADVTENFTDSVSTQVAVKISANNEESIQSAIDSSMQKAVDQMVDKVISSLFPIRVMKISEEGNITLNYGNGLLAAGDIIMVYPKGVDVKLDGSGSPVGDAIATLQVISSERKFSVAQPLDGRELLEKSQQGLLLRTDNSR